MKKIQDYRKESTLNKVFRYPEGLMTRQQWLKMMQVKGWKAEERTRRNYAAEEKLKEWLRVEKMNVPMGNPNYPSTKNYLKEKERLAAGIYKTEYCLINYNSVYDITKTEYEYFNNLILAEDLATEKSQQSEDELMEKEFEFAAKYF